MAAGLLEDVQLWDTGIIFRILGEVPARARNATMGEWHVSTVPSASDNEGQAPRPRVEMAGKPF